MRIIPTIAVAAFIATSLTGCISYSKHESEERVVAHRSGGYHAERHDRHGGYYGHGHHDHHRDHYRDRDHHDRGDRYHPRGR